MAQIVESTSLDQPGLEVYTSLTQAQLRNRLEPEKGVFIAESPKVIARALEAGCQPLSLLMERRHKEALSTNIDFYSGFVYEMLGLPKELYTPLFAVARIAGWSAHRMEELSAGGKLIRPRYECVEEHRSYTPMEQR